MRCNTVHVTIRFVARASAMYIIAYGEQDSWTGEWTCLLSAVRCPLYSTGILRVIRYNIFI